MYQLVDPNEKETNWFVRGRVLCHSGVLQHSYDQSDFVRSNAMEIGVSDATETEARALLFSQRLSMYW